MAKHPKDYFKNEKVINFGIIHHEMRDDPLQGSYENYQRVKCKDLQKYPLVEKKNVVSVLIHNVKRNDMYIDKTNIKQHFLK